MKTLAALLLLAAPALAWAAPHTYELPDIQAELAPGPNADLTMGNCSACHSNQYITTQPRGLANPKAFWTAEVTKMKAVYGAPIDDADMPKIVDYLVATYGK